MKKRNLLITLIAVSSLFFLLALRPGQTADPFAKDSDHDGFVDDLETATKFNPLVNEPLKRSTAEGKCGVIKTDLLKIGAPQNVLIILDISGSMMEPLGTSTKIEVAKKVVGKYIDSLPSTMKAGLVIYGKTDCGDSSIELLAPVGRLNKAMLKARVQGLRPSGSTPIAMTLNKSTDYFRGLEKDNNNLILISDGMESCGGDPIKAIRDLKESDANPEVTVIGLNVDMNTRKQLAGIAASSDGTYEDVKSEEDFVKAFASFFRKMSRFYKDIVCIVKQYNSYLTYESDQYNKSKSYLTIAGMKAKDDATRAALKRVEEQIDANHNARIAAKDRLDAMIGNKMEEMEEATKKFVGKE